MKKTQEIIGLPIISISDGIEIGKVKSIIINADKGAIDYIVVDSGIQILSARVIPTDNILGIGEYALTIENEGAVNDISKIPAAIDLLQKNIQVRGAKVLTKKGRLIGEIGDIFIDEDDCCKIIGLEYIADITQKKIRIIPRESVITFGKNLVVVKDDVESFLLDRPAQLGAIDRVIEFEKKNLVSEEEIAAASFSEQDLQTVSPFAFEDSRETNESQASESQTGESETIESVINEIKTSENQTSQSPTGTNGTGSAAYLFEQKQRQYLKGRRAAKTITDSYGNIIISEGMEITDDIIDEAKAKGKLVELIMNNKI